jgi:DNA-binding beta-propeller fold protein YncE
VLQGPDAHTLKPFVVAGRKRLATCSGVAWFRGYHLAVVNLYGRHLRTYRFHPQGDAQPPRLELLHELTDGLSYPEDVAVSPDGKLLAISHSMSHEVGVSLHSIDPVSLAPSPIVKTLRAGVAFHSVKFSPDSRHLAFTEIGNPGFVEIVRVSSPQLERTCLLENRHGSLKPKSIAFSDDGDFAFVSMTLNVTPRLEVQSSGGALFVHRFDAENGVIGTEVLAELRGTDIFLGNVEICRVLPHVPGKPYRILLVNQGADLVSAFEFDPVAHSLSLAGIFASGLSFPHGLDVSHDGKYVAITAYGDDSLHIARTVADRPHPASSQACS